ncbi:hypothetical protein HK096_000019 [Nowakowskiella sp. JEL0078]|nr:hypothetical protein HK096_000019 [Nowakowskiella sp. JEL0078]
MIPGQAPLLHRSTSFGCTLSDPNPENILAVQTLTNPPQSESVITNSENMAVDVVDDSARTKEITPQPEQTESLQSESILENPKSTIASQIHKIPSAAPSLDDYKALKIENDNLKRRMLGLETRMDRLNNVLFGMNQIWKWVGNVGNSLDSFVTEGLEDEKANGRKRRRDE